MEESKKREEEVKRELEKLEGELERARMENSQLIEECKRMSRILEEKDEELWQKEQ